MRGHHGYNIYRSDRTHKVGGGLLIAVETDISSLRRKDIETNCEVSAVELRFNSAQKTLVLAFYRPPDYSLEFVHAAFR